MQIETPPIPWLKFGESFRDIPHKDVYLDRLLHDSNFDTSKVYADINKKHKEIDGKLALYNKHTEKVIKIVNDNYNHENVLKNSYSTITDFIKGSKMDFDEFSLGKFSQYGKVWAVIRLRGLGFQLFGDDKVRCYLLFTFSEHNYQHIEIRLIALRLVCSNGMTSTVLNIVIGTADLNDDFFKLIRQRMNNWIDYYDKHSYILSQCEYEKKDVYNYLAEFFGVDKNDPELLSKTGLRVYESIRSQPGNEYGNKTWWNVFNAVTHEIDHYRPYSNGRIYSTWYGKYRDMKARALTRAIEYILVDKKFSRDEYKEMFREGPGDILF